MLNKIEDRPDYSFRLLHPEQQSEVAPPLLDFSDRNSEILFQHVQKPASFQAGFSFAKNIIISGTSVAMDKAGPLLLGALQPGYVDSYTSKNLIKDTHNLEGKTPRRMIGLSAAVGHFNIGVYGHWLLECVPKLMLLAGSVNDLPPFRLVMHRWAPDFVFKWIELILPNTPVEIYDFNTEYLVCDEVIFPSCLARNGYFFHPISNMLFDDLVKAYSKPSAPRSLYLTRQSQSGYREMSNRNEIESIARSAGLEMISPETLSIPDQISLFSNANLIVGEFGSAMHNSIFSDAHTKVFCLNWIVNVQSRIAQLRGQEIGYQLPSDGHALKFVEGDANKRLYHIDPDKFARNLERLIPARG